MVALQLLLMCNGCGFPEMVSFDSSIGFGLTLAKALANQLGGSIRDQPWAVCPRPKFTVIRT